MAKDRYVTVATRLRDRMVEQGYNPTSLATSAGLERNYVRSALRGLDDPTKGFVPKLDKLRAIARELDCSVDYLLGESKEIGESPTESASFRTNYSVDATVEKRPLLGASEARRAAVAAPDIHALPRDVPVYGTTADDHSGAQRMTERTPVNFVTRFPGIAKERDVYALHVDVEDMAPRHYRGEIVYVSPHRPARAGDYVVVQVENGAGVLVYIKRLVRRDGQAVVLERHSPPEGEPAEIEIDAARVRAVHKILDLNELMGA